MEADRTECGLYDEINMLLSMARSEVTSLLVHAEDPTTGIALHPKHVTNLLWQVERNLDEVRKCVGQLADYKNAQ